VGGLVRIRGGIGWLNYDKVGLLCSCLKLIRPFYKRVWTRGNVSQKLLAIKVRVGHYYWISMKLRGKIIDLIFFFMSDEWGGLKRCQERGVVMMVIRIESES